MPAKGIYIYGIVPNFYGTKQFQLLESSGVYAISFQNISAIVSDRESVHLDLLDRESLGYLLVHHQETIEELHRKGFTMIIPMRLGTIVSSIDDVLKILTCGFDLMIDTLKNIEYLTEIDLAVTWADFPGILNEVANHPDIMALKNQLLQSGTALTQVDQVKVGMLLQEKLDEKNKLIELKILDALSTISIDIKIHEVMNDLMVTNSAVLMKRNNARQFEHAIEKLDEEFNGALNFKIVGPLPCYSFFTLEIKELNHEQVEQARKELGINEKTTENEIKKAYLEKAKLFHPDNSHDIVDTDNFNTIQKAYHMLIDYASAVRQLSKEEYFSLTKETMIENLILIKIKE